MYTYGWYSTLIANNAFEIVKKESRQRWAEKNKEMQMQNEIRMRKKETERARN